MAPKAAQEAVQKKAAKQRKILMILALPMLGAVFYAYTTLSSLGNKPGAVSATPAAQTTSTGAIPPADPLSAPVTPGVATAPVGTLGTFVTLGRKDPFFDNGPHAATASSSSSKSKPPKKTHSGGSKTKLPTAPLTGAVISLNGKKLALAIGTTFGHAPGLSGVALFRLASVSPRSAEVDVVGTQQHFTLHVGRPLTLEQDGGWKYTLILEPLGSAAPMTVQTTTQPTFTTTH
jgi:hypothetical protein